MKPRHFLLGLGLILATTAFANFLTDIGKTVTDQVKGNKTPASTPNLQDTATKVKEAGQPISIEEETAIGESVALEVISQFGPLVRDPKINRRVTLIGRAVARYSDRPDLNWQFGVLESDTVNALSTPGGFVFITKALYKQAQSDDELAGVLGHEIIHITRKHALGAVKGSRNMAATDALLGTFSSKYRDEKAKVQSVSENLKQFDINIGDISKAIITKGYDSPKEFDADAGGRQLAATAGYAGGGLRSVLIQLKANGGDSKKVFSTHPPLDDRIKHLPNEPAKLAANP